MRSLKLNGLKFNRLKWFTLGKFRLGWLSLGLAIALFILWPLPMLAQSETTTTQEIRGVWLTNISSAVFYVPWGLQRALKQLAQLQFNTVYPVVWNRGYTFYPSAIAQPVTGANQDPFLQKLRLGQDPLAVIVKQGHRLNLKVIPWFEYGFMAPARSELVRRHPDWVTHPQKSASSLRDRSTLENKAVNTQQVWLNPLHPDVQQFMLDLVIEVIKTYPVDGIQLDDHFGLPIELGYDAFTVQLYQQEHGGDRPPTDITDAAWMQWRATKLSSLMQRLHQAVKSIRPDCLISLSPNSRDFAYRFYLQDWLTWVEQGWIDQLVVQVYRDELESFRSEIQTWAIQIARQTVPVGIGIYTGSLRHPVSIDQIQQQVETVRQIGLSGVSFFYWESLWGYITPDSPRTRRAKFQEMFGDRTADSVIGRTEAAMNHRTPDFKG